MNDNYSFSSFMMLTQHLYQVFEEYILEGRTRAPPETDLIEMLPTFQLGAKTDRRALQSKFKSWAKRMDFENGCLVLANTGKIIIPREKCDELIMHFHSPEHKEVEKVIAQIRKRYSWTRKNFGMDRDVVIDSLTRNCKNEDCHKKIRMEIAKLSNTLCSNVQNYEIPGLISEMTVGMPPPLPCLPSYYPVAFPLPPPMFPPSGFPFQIPFFNTMYAMGNNTVTRKKMSNVMKNDRKNSSDLKVVPNKEEEKTSTSNEDIPQSHLNDTLKAETMRFKRPKTEYDYKVLMKAVGHKPREFPEILRDEKTRFLSTLGLAPKSICSSRTLRKFRKELKSKQFLNRDCMIYRERKILRDKNKLKKCSNQRKVHFYLGMPVRTSSTTVLPEKTFKEVVTGKSSKFLKATRKLNENKSACSNRKRMKLMHSDAKPIEVITIASSDEETPQEDSLQPEESIDKGTKEISLNQSDSERFPDNFFHEVSVGQSSETLANTKQSDKNHNQDDNLQSETINKTISSEDFTRHKPTLLETIRSRILNARKNSLSKDLNNYESNQSSRNSKILVDEKMFRPLQITTSSVGHANTVINNSPNYLVPHMDSTSLVIRQAVPLLSQHQTRFATCNQNNASNILYHPVAVPKTSISSRLIVVDKNQNGTLYIIPQQKKFAVSQNPPRILPQATLYSQQGLKNPMSVMSSTSQLPQLKPKNKEKDSALSEKLFRKVMKENIAKVDINEEMMRIATWIYRMKSNLNPSMFTQGIEKSVQKLLSQLDIGIYLVNEAKKSLKEIDNFIDIPNPTEGAE